MRNISLLGRGKVIISCSYLFMLVFVGCRRLSVQYVTIPMLFVCMCGDFSLARLTISTVWFYWFVTFFESGYVFGGGTLSTSLSRKICSRILGVMYCLVHIRLGREGMRSVFFGPPSGPRSGSLSHVVG